MSSVTRTACGLCQNFCGVLVHVQNGKVVKVEGDPDNPRNHGHACAKGLSGHFALYSPKRIRRPLIRTNPQKGLGVDPKWKEITWDEAVGILADRVKKIRGNPKGFRHKIFLVCFDMWSRWNGPIVGFLDAMQVLHGPFGADCFCGNAIHPPAYLNTASFEMIQDSEYAKYYLLIGAQAGSIIHYDTMNTARHIAEKRPGEVKVVAVDPICSFAASKAEEWVPIRPGTDAAFIMAIVNLLVNEYKIYDADFLKNKTNAPYLIGTDGLYVREPSDDKPLIWDSADNKAKPFDGSIKDFALEGSFSVNDVACQPAFQKVKDYASKYTPEYASTITTVPADTIRKIARELGEAASIGATVNIDGVELPYRPVSVVWYRGLGAHRHAFMTGMAALMLPTLLGAIQVPGGVIGHPPGESYVTDDGLLSVKLDRTRGSFTGPPYPPRQVKKPSRLDVFELFPVSIYSFPMIVPVILEPEKFGMTEEITPDLAVIWRDNPVGNSFAPEQIAETLKKIPFIASIAIEPDETLALADLVIPDLHHFERLAESLGAYLHGSGYWYAAKPAVAPPFDSPYNNLVSVDQLFLEVAKRAGILGECYRSLNKIWKLEDSPHELDTSGEYSYLEIVNRRLKSWLGPDKDINWLLSDEGGLTVGQTNIQEHYVGPFRKGRLHLYYEFMIGAGKDVDRLTKEMSIPWDTSDYQPIPDWKPCPSYSQRHGEYDLFVINSKIPMQVHGMSKLNPVLGQLTDYHRLDYVFLNPSTARRKDIEEGDEVVIETTKGRKAVAVARLSERIHPEVLATMQHRLSKGADFNELITLDKETLDFVGCAVDACILAKVGKAR
ncbi:MAG: molybdopterin-dependent oxidoreductase [Thaumarchaeota archaeon]|nr:molybdopterin-dependent oxidoreductase [Nitrososphaerota archaeon]